MSIARLSLPMLLVVAAGLTACSGGGGDDAQARNGDATLIETEPSGTIAGVGFATPESVLHDEAADVYLVSNINGSPLGEDDNGFISRVSPSGEVEELKWIDGASDDVSLDAPKGMAIVGDILYVTDISVVRMFDRETGAPRGEIAVEGSTFLNDLAPASDGGLYLTDSGLQAGAEGLEGSGADAVYHLTPAGEVHTLLKDTELNRPNGILEIDGSAWVVTFGAAELYRVGEGKEDVTILPAPGLDGLVVVGGDLVVSSWGGSGTVFRGPPGGPFEAVATDVRAPADIGYDETRGRLMIPLFQDDEVRWMPIGN